MSKKEMEEQIIANYQRDEQMMILIFAQWCINHDLNPAEIYQLAYPNQEPNIALQLALDLTVTKDEAGEIPDDTVLGVLSLFGNEELACFVTEEIAKRPQRER
ncbi:hypothetical protein GK047_13055 [Paenibacillus sp. SYP-B3998]|uniref:YxiS n=1 Tax=Paenibacillus sp. SYP-B3998 TaxID=2678564 RepID=A0A6G3ZXR4_9BACL|nr:hypothetical protein [Paenibacillus sp. SYP-B3998]NEW06932.1 hypothetical protein [Paenibacillus sp. SYP-B3998]